MKKEESKEPAECRIEKDFPEEGDVWLRVSFTPNEKGEIEKREQYTKYRGETTDFGLYNGNTVTTAAFSSPVPCYLFQAMTPEGPFNGAQYVVHKEDFPVMAEGDHKIIYSFLYRPSGR